MLKHRAYVRFLLCIDIEIENTFDVDEINPFFLYRKLNVKNLFIIILFAYLYRFLAGGCIRGIKIER